jgi:hypothetical protein
MQAQEFFQNKPKTSLLLAANFGEGKTSVIITFPKLFYIGFRQGGLEVIRQSRNEKFKENLVRYEELCPKSDEELRAMFMPDGRKGLIYKYLDEAKEMAQRGEVETLALDDGTDGVENIQKYIWTFRKKLTEKGGEDTQGMYGDLKLTLSNLIDRDILTFRKFGNVVMSFHVMREAEQTIEGTKTRAGAVDKMSDVYPDIIGSFRREVQRKFENVLYLETKLEPGTRKYRAYTSKQVAFGTVLLAKNCLGLPPIVENVSYETLLVNKTTAQVRA